MYGLRVVAFVVLLAAGCAPAEPRPRSVTLLTMGTLAELTVGTQETADLEKLQQLAEEEFAQVEVAYSVYNPESALSRMNAVAGSMVHHLPPDVLDTLLAARGFAEQTGGAFDPTAGPLVRLWGFQQDREPSMPTAAALAQALSLTGWQRIVLEDDAAGLALPGMAVDLGGIAKGMAVDLVWNAFRAHGVEHFIVNIGGDLRVSGQATGTRLWRIAVRNPFEANGLIGVLSLPSGMSLATSGNYERFVEIEGRRYAHIMDPRSGRPVEGMAGVTVLAGEAMTADALATAFFVMGVGETFAQLAAWPGVHVLMVPDEQPMRILVSEGFDRVFTPFDEWAGRVEVLR